MTSGGNGNCCTDDGYHQLNVQSIFGQLGSQASSLMQSMPKACDTSNGGNYPIRHNPEPYYLPGLGQTLCNNQDVALGSTPDLSAEFTYISPDVCHDMHSNSCTGSSNAIKQGDDYLKVLVPQLMATGQYQAGNTAIFITWDEDNTSNLNPNQIPTVIIDPMGHTPRVPARVRVTHTTACCSTSKTRSGARGSAAPRAQPALKGCFGL